MEAIGTWGEWRARVCVWGACPSPGLPLRACTRRSRRRSRAHPPNHRANQGAPARADQCSIKMETKVQRVRALPCHPDRMATVGQRGARPSAPPCVGPTRPRPTPKPRAVPKQTYIKDDGGLWPTITTTAALLCMYSYMIIATVVVWFSPRGVRQK